MTNLIGEFECRIDVKGRFMLPSGLKKQLPTEEQERFVVNRGFEKCLVLYPRNVWKVISDEINQLNLYNKKNRDFVRYFYRGATELVLDSASRLLLPKQLSIYAGIDKELVLSAFSNRVEIWSKGVYENLLTNEPEDFSTLAEEVMGNKENKEKTGNDLP
ncbi:MAG TPA: division/cell wall cluster transcriptional repressor MraZ [Bacteroidales bacterium]|nr:division/cell wall cluster transcriptional repressor MraZ [Bacteroidales bacterium]HPS16399.1 division/cell wall cluster transcriptional repressor MraZ [Bacteroidales bacterium]